MRKLDPATYRVMPWKNGGGSTTEVLTLPEGATLETFELRVSRARVAADGPFSTFEGVDRTLLVTAGAGLTLRMADDAIVALDLKSRPFAFAGDDACEATLTNGPLEDLNIMTRRARLRHRAARFTLDADRTVACTGKLTLLAVLAGSLVATDDAGRLALGPGDFLTVSPGDPLVVLANAEESPVDLLLVEITRTGFAGGTARE